MSNPECRGCGITPADVPDGFGEAFEAEFEDGLCPACQLHPRRATPPQLLLGTDQPDTRNHEDEEAS